MEPSITSSPDTGMDPKERDARATMACSLAWSRILEFEPRLLNAGADGLRALWKQQR
jgi:hypothetical protein